MTMLTRYADGEPESDCLECGVPTSFTIELSLSDEGYPVCDHCLRLLLFRIQDAITDPHDVARAPRQVAAVREAFEAWDPEESPGHYDAIRRALEVE